MDTVSGRPVIPFYVPYSCLCFENMSFNYFAFDTTFDDQKTQGIVCSIYP